MNCRACNKKMDTHTDVESEGNKPEPGSLSVCFYCGTLSVFDEALQLREATPAEQEELKKDASVWNMLQTLWVAIGERNNKN